MNSDNNVLNGSNILIGRKYNWKNQKERLIYVGKERSNGVWYQFALVSKPDIVWCEVRESDLEIFEETKQGDTK